MASETTISDRKEGQNPAQKTASGVGGWFQRNKTLAIAIGIVVFVIIFYMLYRNNQANAAANNSGAAATGGSTISPADLAGLLSSIPQGPAGAAGARGPAGPRGRRGRRGKTGKSDRGKHDHDPRHHRPVHGHHPIHRGNTLDMPINNRTMQARPPVHPTSQKPAVAQRGR